MGGLFTREWLPVGESSDTSDVATESDSAESLATTSSDSTAEQGAMPSRISTATATAGLSTTTDCDPSTELHDSASVAVVTAASDRLMTASQEKTSLQVAGIKLTTADLASTSLYVPSSSTANEISHSDSTASPESEVLRLYSDKLVTAIKAGDPLSLAIKLYAIGLIEEESREKVGLLVYTHQEKAHIIVSAVQRRVEADPSLFHQFISLLQGDILLTSLSKNIQEDLRKRIALPFHHTSHQSLSPQPQSPLCQYANKLRTVYADSELPKYSNPACYKWAPSPSKKYIDLTTIDRKRMTTLDVDIYKKAALEGENKNIARVVSNVKLEEILLVPDERLKCVLIEGAPGIGKSTLAWQVCHRWGKGELFQQYSTVLLLPLRDQRVQGATCVEDLFISTDRKLQERVRNEVTKKNWDGEDTLIILEGLDELPIHLLSQPSIFTGLLSGEILSQATILITSRPSATEQLHKKWKRRITRHLEITGFIEENVNAYEQSVLSDHELSGFKKYLSVHPRIKSMLYVPLHCVIAVTVYLQCQQSRTPPPKTLTGLYTCLTQTILIQYLNDHPQDENCKLDTVFDLHIPCPVHDYFKELCRIAFEHVIDQKLVFPNLPKELHDLGFTDAVPEFLLYQQSANSSYNFLHLSVQEFLAAYHVSLMNSSEQEEFLKTNCHKSHFKNMFRFVAGITKFKGLNKIDVRRVLGIHVNISQQSGSLDNYCLELLYEWHDASILDTELTYTVKLTQPLPYLCLALGYSIANSSCGWRLELQWCSSSTQADMIIQGLKESKAENANYRIRSIYCEIRYTEFICKLFTQHTLEKFITHKESLIITLWCPSLSLPGRCRATFPLPYSCLLELIPKMERLNTLVLEYVRNTSLTELIPVLSRVPTLRNLTLHEMNSEATALLCQWFPSPTCQLEKIMLPSFSPDCIEMVSSSLSKVSTLKTLMIWNSEFTFQCMQAFASMLQQNQSLTELIISACGIDSDSACCLAKALHHNTALRKIDYHCPLKGREVLAMAEMLKNNTTLEELNFGQVWLSSDITMAEALHHNTTLRKLNISGPLQKSEEKGALAIAEMIKYNTSLKDLKLNYMWISSDGAIKMAEALHYNTTLRKLNIRSNPVGEKGAQAMAEMLKHNTTLEELNLRNAKISSDGAVVIAEALHHNKTLRKLDMSGNPVGERGALAMADVLKHSTTLEELNLSDAGIESTGTVTVAMAEALHNNTTLRKLGMSGNPVGEKEALAMAEILKHNTTLEELDLRNRDIVLLRTHRNSEKNMGDKSIKALIESLAENQRLKKLIIQWKYKEVVESHSLYRDHKERVMFYNDDT